MKNKEAPGYDGIKAEPLYRITKSIGNNARSIFQEKENFTMVRRRA